jgi:hypothetical protein
MLNTDQVDPTVKTLFYSLVSPFGDTFIYPGFINFKKGLNKIKNQGYNTTSFIKLGNESTPYCIERPKERPYSLELLSYPRYIILYIDLTYNIKYVLLKLWIKEFISKINKYDYFYFLIVKF